MINQYLEKIIKGEDLLLEEMEKAMSLIMEGKTSVSQIAGFLVALRMKGESITEITAAAKVMRAKAARITSKKEIIDTCGTGGDAKGTFNISTTVALVLAGAGLTVAKHGNRSVSSKSGSADVLEALGVNLDLSVAKVQNCLDEIGIAFLFAPVFHQAMKYAIKPRKELKLRTIFNILGPLTNPAFANYQVLGVYSQDLVYPLIRVLKNLGLKSAMVVHGAGGIDELSLSGANIIAYLNDGEIENLSINPQKLGLKPAKLSQLAGGSPEINKEIILSVLQGKKGAKRDIVLLNSACALLVAGKVKSWQEGINLAAHTIDEKKAYQKLQDLITFTNSEVNK